MIRTVWGVGVLALLSSLAYGQKADAKLQFEVASVKPAEPMPMQGMMRVGIGGGPGTGDPGRVTYSNASMMMLLTNAYSVKRSQISGPDWLDSQRFDITAKVPEGATKDDVKVMLQNLLADRFKLTLHRQTKEMGIYALVVAKNGPKLQASTATDPAAADPGGRGPEGSAPPPLPPPPPGGPGGPGPVAIGRLQMKDGCPEIPPGMKGRGGNLMMMTPAGACMISNGVTLDMLADQLSNQFDRPVMNLTEIAGKYDIKLRFDPSSMPGRGGMIMMGPKGGGPGGPMGDGGRSPDAEERDMPPTIFAALQEQLGLKLDSRKGTVTLLVIDHLEKTPTEN